MEPVFVLVHSPLVGPVTWSLVAREMDERGVQAVIPEIRPVDPGAQYWQQNVHDVARSVETISGDAALIVVGHSGAGQLLPAIRGMLPHTVVGYVFVDAGIPVDGLSRLDLMRLESTDFAGRFQASLESGKRFPAWTDDMLREIILDDRFRAEVLSDLRPQPLAFFDEPIPVFEGWPDAPCGYVHFTPAYDVFAEHANARDWPYRRLDGGHFHMLVDPQSVTDAILDVVPQ